MARQTATDATLIEQMFRTATTIRRFEEMVAYQLRSRGTRVYPSGGDGWRHRHEIASQITERCFTDLNAPVVRVGAPFAPVPLAGSLEHAYQPNNETIADVVRGVVRQCEFVTHLTMGTAREI